MSTAPTASDVTPGASRRRRHSGGGGGVRGGGSGGRRWLRSVEQVGRGVRVTGPVLVRGPGTVILGDDVVLDAAEAPIELLAAPGGRLEIGSGAYVGPGASLEAGASLSVGPGAVIGEFAKLLDNNWHGLGDDRHARTDSTPVIVGAGAKVGARAIMVPGATLGDGSVLGDDSVLSGRVPAGVHVAGVPARRVAPLASDIPGPVSPSVDVSAGRPGNAAFPTVSGGPGPVGTPRLAWLAGLEGLGRLPLPEAAQRGLAKAQLGAALLNARRQLRAALTTGRVYVYGTVDVSGPGKVEIGDRTTFVGGPMRTRIDAGPGATVRIGQGVTFNYGVFLRAAERVEIGSGSLFGSRVLILDRHDRASGPVHIGRDVWLAHGVTVLPGVTIGDGSAVSAGVVVDRDVPAGSLAYGAPLRFRAVSTVAAAR